MVEKVLRKCKQGRKDEPAQVSEISRRQIRAVPEKSWIRTQPPAILLPSDPTVQLHLEKENNKGGKLALIVLPGWLKENCM